MGVLSDLRHAFLRWFYRRFFRLSVTKFTKAHAALVQQFHCGDKPWHEALNLWISTNDVFDDIDKFGTAVWIYRRGNKVVGYGSVGKTWRPYPPGQKQFLWVALIPMVAVQTDFQGRPRKAARDEKYAGQIMNHLIFEAKKLGLPDLALYVHAKNEQAKKFYRKFGFTYQGLARDGHEIMGRPIPVMREQSVA